jgi:hypothetical protein
MPGAFSGLRRADKSLARTRVSGLAFLWRICFPASVSDRASQLPSASRCTAPGRRNYRHRRNSRRCRVLHLEIHFPTPAYGTQMPLQLRTCASPREAVECLIPRSLFSWRSKARSYPPSAGSSVGPMSWHSASSKFRYRRLCPSWLYWQPTPSPGGSASCSLHRSMDHPSFRQWRCGLDRVSSATHSPWRCSVRPATASRSQLERSSAVYRLSPWSGQSAFAPILAPCCVVLPRGESWGVPVHATRIPHTPETMRLRPQSPSRSIRQKIVGYPSTAHCPTA